MLKHPSLLTIRYITSISNTCDILFYKGHGQLAFGFLTKAASGTAKCKTVSIKLLNIKQNCFCLFMVM